MIIRPRKDHDSGALIALAREVHATDGYPPYVGVGGLERFLLGHDALGAWVCETEDARPVGHVALHPRTGAAAMETAASALEVTTERLGVVARFMVAPDHRRQGIGQELLNPASAEARRNGLTPVLDVAIRFEQAWRLYERKGWIRLGAVSMALPDGIVLREYVYVAGATTPNLDEPGAGAGHCRY